jgi:hypothetical protein
MQKVVAMSYVCPGAAVLADMHALLWHCLLLLLLPPPPLLLPPVHATSLQSDGERLCSHNDLHSNHESSTWTVASGCANTHTCSFAKIVSQRQGSGLAANDCMRLDRACIDTVELA